MGEIFGMGILDDTKPQKAHVRSNFLKNIRVFF
jgi:hypothetical protein